VLCTSSEYCSSRRGEIRGDVTGQSDPPLKRKSRACLRLLYPYCLIMSLPYDATSPPSPPKDDAEPSALDRPLDDYASAIPAHVTDLMSRMGKGKVYLLEESPGILHVDVNEKMYKDPVSYLSRPSTSNKAD
jgi:hypothetical protein